VNIFMRFASKPIPPQKLGHDYLNPSIRDAVDENGDREGDGQRLLNSSWHDEEQEVSMGAVFPEPEPRRREADYEFELIYGPQEEPRRRVKLAPI